MKDSLSMKRTLHIRGAIWHGVNYKQFLKTRIGIDVTLEGSIMSEAEKWNKLFTRIIDVVVLLGERGLPFRGSS